ncbi:MAG TPA: hypothetical protein PLN48_05470 [Lachnospiraceae bacterium]|nr:hypothetical protein [Lachnospiraceae bacterium]
MSRTAAEKRSRRNGAPHKADRYQVDGTAARKLQADTRVRRKNAARRTLSPEISRNRRKALTMSRGYVLFLAVMCVATVLMCVHYLQLKEMITSQTEANEKLDSKLTDIKSENDALLENVTNNIDWSHVKDVAINKLGMKYATEDEVVCYNTNDNAYVRQYQDVPSE